MSRYHLDPSGTFIQYEAKAIGEKSLSLVSRQRARLHDNIVRPDVSDELTGDSQTYYNINERIKSRDFAFEKVLHNSGGTIIYNSRIL